MGYFEKRGKNSFRLNVELGIDGQGKKIIKRRTIKVEESLLKTTRKLQDHLNMELAKFQMEIESGEYISPEKMLFRDFVKEWETKWAEKKVSENKFSPLTLKTYKGHLENHILPVIGSMRIEQIKTFHLVNLFNELSKDGGRKDGKDGKLSGGTMEYIHRVLKNVLSRAAEWKLIKENPMDGVDKPAPDDREELFYEEDEAHEVLEALYKEPDKWRLFFMGSMFGGFRRGELVALEWTDADFEKGGFHINKSISMTVDGQAIVKNPKTKKSKSFVKMPGWYMDELKSYRLAWMKEKLSVGELWQGGDKQYIFHGGFGKPFYHTTPTTTWKRFLSKHNLKFVRLHDLRHTTATLLIEKYLEDGADAELALKAIQEHLRHSRFHTTMDRYGHITKKVSEGAAKKFDDFDPRKRKTQ